MGNKRQQEANARNSRKSTGPRTESGKQRSSRNARRHGLNQPLPQERVLEFLRIILESSDAKPGSPGYDQIRQSALVLAEAEARLERVRRLEEAFLSDLEEGRPLDSLLRSTWAVTGERMFYVNKAKPRYDGSAKLPIPKITIEKIFKLFHKWHTPESKLGSLRRYRAMAEVARIKALSNWIDINRSSR